MTGEDARRLRREKYDPNPRCAQLQDDIADLTTQLSRMRRRSVPGAPRSHAPNPVSGGR